MQRLTKADAESPSCSDLGSGEPGAAGGGSGGAGVISRGSAGRQAEVLRKEVEVEQHTFGGAYPLLTCHITLLP